MTDYCTPTGIASEEAHGTPSRSSIVRVQPVGIHGSYELGRPGLVTGMVRLDAHPNALDNPRAQYNADGWATSWFEWWRVTDAPIAIPAPGTAIYVAPASSGAGIENSVGLPLPSGVGPGDWLGVQLTMLLAGATDAEAVLSLTVSWYDDEGGYIAGGPPDSFANIVNDAYWRDDYPRDVALIDALLPLTWTRYATSVQVPTGQTPNAKNISHFDFCLTVNTKEDQTGNGADLAAMWFTNMRAEPGAAGWVPGAYAEGDAAAGWRIRKFAQSGCRSSWSFRTPWLGEAVRAEVKSAWDIQADPVAVRSTTTSSWRLPNLVRTEKLSSWDIVTAVRVRSASSSSWRIRDVVRSAKASTWDVWNNPVDPPYTPPWEVPVPQYRTIAQLNGINLNDGITTFLMPGAQLGDDSDEFDLIRHYDGSLVQHDVRGTLVDMSIPVKFACASPSDLNTLVNSVRASARAGGSFTWADGGSVQGPLQTFQLAVGSGSDAPRDFLFRKRNTAIYVVKMTRFPR